MDFLTNYINEVIKKEGDGRYTDDYRDSGGPTRWGVTQRQARAHGYAGDMREISREKAVEILTQSFWIKPGFDRVERFIPALAAQLFDFGVLAGPHSAIRILQRCLNVLNLNGANFPDIKVDGLMGDVSTVCLGAFIKLRGEEGEMVLCEMARSLCGAYLIDLVERRSKDEKYIYGWFKNRIMEGATI